MKNTTSYFNYNESNNPSNSHYIGNNNLPDAGTLKPDYSLLLVLPCVVCLLFLVCLFNYCMKKLSNQTVSTSNPSEEIFMPLVSGIQREEFHNIEL